MDFSRVLKISSYCVLSINILRSVMNMQVVDLNKMNMQHSVPHKSACSPLCLVSSLLEWCNMCNPYGPSSVGMMNRGQIMYLLVQFFVLHLPSHLLLARPVENLLIVILRYMHNCISSSFYILNPSYRVIKHSNYAHNVFDLKLLK